MGLTKYVIAIVISAAAIAAIVMSLRQERSVVAEQQAKSTKLAGLDDTLAPSGSAANTPSRRPLRTVPRNVWPTSAFGEQKSGASARTGSPGTAWAEAVHDANDDVTAAHYAAYAEIARDDDELALLVESFEESLVRREQIPKDHVRAIVAGENPTIEDYLGSGTKIDDERRARERKILGEARYQLLEQVLDAKLRTAMEGIVLDRESFDNP